MFSGRTKGEIRIETQVDKEPADDSKNIDSTEAHPKHHS
jgi:hypothetical protein